MSNGINTCKMRRCISPWVNIWMKQSQIHKAKHKSSFHILLTALKSRFPLLRNMRGFQLGIRTFPRSLEKPELSICFSSTFPKIHDHYQILILPPLSLKGNIAANHSHILSFQFTTNWVHCQQLRIIRFFISVPVITVG